MIDLIDMVERPGMWRDVSIEITAASHAPPHHLEVRREIDEMCEYVQSYWGDRTPIHLASYAMWRLNWIHPFVDGNGRTSRIISYLVLCAKLGYRLPGTKTIPERIAENKRPYYMALEAADRAWKEGRVDVSEMENCCKPTSRRSWRTFVSRLSAAIATTSNSVTVPTQPFVFATSFTKL